MKRIYSKFHYFLAHAAFVIFLIPAVHGQTILYTESFETDGEGSRYTSNTYNYCAGAPGANPDYFLRLNTNPALPAGTCATGHGTALAGLQGSFYWAGEDIRSNLAAYPGALPPGSIVTSPINITSYGSLTVSLYLATSNNVGTRWEDADSINIQSKIGAGQYRTVGRFMGTSPTGGNLCIDANLNGVLNGTETSTICDVSTFTKYTFNIAGTGTTLRIQIDFDQWGGSEESAIDLIEVRGTVIVPVRWESFTGQQIDESVKLDWATTEEVNVREFEIERLTGDGTYSSIGTVSANGVPGSYKYMDAQPIFGTNIYRIKQVDTDNSYTYSEAIEVQVEQVSKIVVYPNPMKEVANILIEGDPITGSMGIYDNAGRKLRTFTFENASELQIARAGLVAGIYHLRLDLENGRSFTKKLMVGN